MVRADRSRDRRHRRPTRLLRRRDLQGGRKVILGRVMGTIVSTIQHPFYARRKQLIVRAVPAEGAFDGDKYVVAVDLVGAGVGELVVVEDEGNSARQLLEAENAPIRSVVVGIVDEVTVDVA